MFATDISKDEVNELVLNRYEGKIVLIDHSHELQKAFAEIMQHEQVGFDTETKPVFVKGMHNDVSLLQIAIPEKVFLIRINKTGISKEIIDFFENERIQKIGVGLKDDIVCLKKMIEFEPNGFVELSETVNALNIKANGLRKLVAIILGFRISKNAQVSNWEAEKLSNKQLTYAATDAWACLEMYNKLSQLALI